MMVIKQITGFTKNIIAVFVLAICGAIVEAWLHGEVHTLDSFPHVIYDSIPFAIVCVCGWILLKSPFSDLRFTLADMRKAANTGEFHVPEQKK